MHILLGQMLYLNGEVETFWAFDFDSCVRFSWSHCSGGGGAVCALHIALKSEKVCNLGELPLKSKINGFFIIF